MSLFHIKITKNMRSVLELDYYFGINNLYTAMYNQETVNLYLATSV